jgi:hypothetical protein
MNRGSQRVCAWGFAAGGLLLAVALPLARIVPPPSPAASAQEIRDMYVHHATAIRIGMVIAMMSSIPMFAFVAELHTQLERAEGRPAVFSRAAYAAFVSMIALGALTWMVWLAAAFRPDDVSPDVTRALNDLGWMLMLIPAPIFNAVAVAMSIIVLRDKRPKPIFPRWIGYLCISVVLLDSPALLIPFFKTGPFDFRGLFGFYVSVGALGVWVVVTTWGLLRAIDLPESSDGPRTYASVAER